MNVFGKSWYVSLPMKERLADAFRNEKKKAGYETVKQSQPDGRFVVKYRKLG